MADRLQVTVVEARDLREKDPNKKNSSFVQIYLVNKTHQKLKTKIIEKSNEPKWNDEFFLYVLFGILFHSFYFILVTI
jgi:Ca2+-dependent lipid-binding protein